MVDFIIDFYFADAQDLETFLIKEWYAKLKPIGYSGMVGKKSQELRLSSVSKGEKPICYVSFNKDGYIKHCKDYKNYQDWIKHRNPIRYESNLHKSYEILHLIFKSFSLINFFVYKIFFFTLFTSFSLQILFLIYFSLHISIKLHFSLITF